MAVPELDLAGIVAPIPGDNPGGTRMPFMIRQKLEAARKEFEPNPDDPSAAPVPKKAEWATIVRTATKAIGKHGDVESVLFGSLHRVDLVVERERLVARHVDGDPDDHKGARSLETRMRRNVKRRWGCS